MSGEETTATLPSEITLMWCSHHHEVCDVGRSKCRGRLRDEHYGWEPITDCKITHRVRLEAVGNGSGSQS